MAEYVRSSDLISLILKYKTGSWTQLVEQSGVHERHLRRIRRGEYELTTLALADRLCMAVGLDVLVELEVIEATFGGIKRTETCRRGHRWTEESTKWVTKGKYRVRICRECKRFRERRRREGVHRITNEAT